MTMRTRGFFDSLTLRWNLVRSGRSKAVGNRFTKRGMTLVLGAALSVGGTSQIFSHVHYIVERDLDHLQVVKQRSGEGRELVAQITDKFAANSIYKLTQILPESLVSRRSSLLDGSWFPISSPEGEKHDSTFATSFAFIDKTIREKFFQTQFPFGNVIHQQAEKYDVDPALVAAVIETESRFRENARSQVGAQGLMQLMPRTGRWMGARNLYDADQNVEAGVKYLKYLDGRFDGNLKKTIAAYNAGEGNVRRFNGVPPYRETRNYVKNVLSRYERNTRQLEQYREARAVETRGVSN
ncbi:MAG TPA: lytic transglycosylase domain-containing protein [Thermoanaerobaculia bacterium]|nr:lytic transglycosylase domain-containing protein [Thermoanaerobaculia bacterium]